MTATFTVFATKVTQEQKISFEIVADPFYSQANMGRLEKAIKDAKEGHNMVEHELIEIE